MLPATRIAAEYNEQADRIPSLDGLRAISISLVVLGHLLYAPEFISIRPVFVKWFAPLGDLGVKIFFVISGFLITGLLLRELDVEKRIYLTRFYFRRTLRIFPPYYFFILVVITLQMIGWVTLVPGDILHALTYTVNYHSERSWYIGHSWSLSVEEQFYLLWPTVLLLIGRRRGLWIAFSVVALCPLIRLSIWYLFPFLLRDEIGYRFETVADSIAAGCLLAGTHEWFKRKYLYHKILGSRFFILVPIAVYYASLLPRGSRLNLLCWMTVQNIGIAACIAWCITNYSSKIGKVLNSKPVVFVGVMSYSIYLWQQPFLNAESSAVVCRFPLNLILIGAASLASYYCIERPVLRIRERLENRLFAQRRRPAQDGVILLADSNISSTSSTLTVIPQNDREHSA
jgi:peptidoglycan/LPS O-acetylase OafA/YrhL